jgi:hypothetical protein
MGNRYNEAVDPLSEEENDTKSWKQDPIQRKEYVVMIFREYFFFFFFEI